MPSGKNYVRDYSMNGEGKYKAKPEQIKKRTQRNAARAKLKKAGVNVAGKDVDHKNNNTSNNSLSNLRAQAPSQNRSFKRNKKAGRYAHGGVVTKSNCGASMKPTQSTQNTQRRKRKEA